MHLFVNPNEANTPFQPDDFLTFFHAQRTGGSALRHVIGRAWEPRFLYCTQNVPDFAHWPLLTEDILKNFKGFAGHSNYEPKEIGRRKRMITLLRHPVYRNISIYYYAKKYPNQFLHTYTHERTLSEFYRHTSPIKPKYFNNVMCRRICGTPKFEPAREMIESSYWAVGLTEYFDDFVKFLLGALGAPEEPQPNLGSDAEKYAEEIQDTDLVDEIIANNTEDLKLFEHMNDAYFNSEYTYPKARR